MLVLLGANHRSAPVEFRERMSVQPDRIGEMLEALIAVDGIEEVLLLSTCNRVEILARSGEGKEEGLAALRGHLEQFHDISTAELQRFTYHHVGRVAVEHLFRVAAGLDSMILGEPQILGQVKRAYRDAKQHGTTGPVLERLLQHALRAAKRARTETGISRHAVSVAFAAVALAGRVFGDLTGRAALIIGAGKMSDLLARHLSAKGVRDLTICSRTYNNTVAAAARVGGRPVHWDEGLSNLGRVDIVVSCTGAPGRVVSARDVSAALRARRSEPLFLIDIAVPRDIDPEVDRLDNAYLYDIDALQSVVDGNLDERRNAAREAERLLRLEVDGFERWRQAQGVAPLIVELRETLLGMGRDELARFRRKLGPLDERQEQAIEELTRGLIRKILHRPIRHLRDAADRGEVDRCASLYRKIFGMGEGEPPAPAASGPQRLLRGGKDR